MKYVCTVCGWSTESDKAPEKCPICGATTFREVGGAEKVYACEHKVGDGVVEDKESFVDLHECLNDYVEKGYISYDDYVEYMRLYDERVNIK